MKGKTTRHSSAFAKAVRAHPILVSNMTTAFILTLIGAVLKLYSLVTVFLVILAFIAGIIISWDLHTYFNKPQIDKLIRENTMLKANLRHCQSTSVSVKPQHASAPQVRGSSSTPVIDFNTVRANHYGR